MIPASDLPIALRSLRDDRDDIYESWKAENQQLRDARERMRRVNRG